MRPVISAALIIALGSAVPAQSPVHEYRPEIILTLPRLHGFGLQFAVEQHLETSNLAPNERILGMAVSSPLYGHIRLAFETRQVELPTLTEYRYIPMVFSTIPIGDGFELRSRSRVEIRDIRGTWSQRYQNRSAFGHDVRARGVSAFAYGQLDFHYDSRFSTLNRIDKSVGARIALIEGSSIDLFFTRQDDTRRTPAVLYATGALLRVAL